MAKFIIETTSEEQSKVLNMLKLYEGEELSARTIADAICMSKSRVRYILQDLVDAGKIERVATKAYNNHYIRYSYRIIRV